MENLNDAAENGNNVSKVFKKSTLRLPHSLSIQMALSLSILLSGCANQGDAKLKGQTEKPSIQQEYANHAISARTNDPDHINRILERVKRRPGVVLYFHGGLSDSTYMRDTLGPNLLATLFRKENLNGLYPIFVNYDAGPFDWEKLKQYAKNTLLGQIATKIIAKILGNNDKGFDKSFQPINEIDIHSASRKFLDEYSDKTLDKSLQDENQYLDFLVDDSAILEKARIITVEDTALDEIHQDIQNLYDDKSLFGFGPIRTAKILVRTAVRFATKTNHQLEPTAVEEILRELKIIELLDVESLIQNHWETVIERSQEIWQEGQNGNLLFEGLMAIKQERKSNNKAFKIKLLSHSAGSIPTAYLVEHAANIGADIIDDIIMVVPAINQRLFIDTIIEYPQSYNRFRAFVLKEKQEEDDKIAWGLYQASLLYFVSGIAEKKGFGDRTLLVRRHLDENRWPYNSDKYRKYLSKVQGDPRIVWKFFSDTTRLVFSPDSSGIAGRESDGSTHEDTKLVWSRKKLAKSLIFLLTDGEVTDPYIPDLPSEEDALVN